MVDHVVYLYRSKVKTMRSKVLLTILGKNFEKKHSVYCNSEHNKSIWSGCLYTGQGLHGEGNSETKLYLYNIIAPYG